MRLGRISKSHAVWIATVGIAFTAAGCGSGGTQPARYTSGSGVIHYLHSIPLARQVVPGGAVDLFGVLYRFMGKTYLDLQTMTEAAGSSTRSRASDLTIGIIAKGKTQKPKLVEISVERSCIAGHRYAFAYGLLHAARDHVVADGANGRVVQFHKVSIPAELDADGILVYHLLDEHPTTILTRDPGGRVLRRESYGSTITSLGCAH